MICRVAADGDYIVSFKQLNLHPKLLKAIDITGFDKPTDVQRDAIPLVLEGRDIMASAQTGTGKTAAFVLPVLHRLMNPAKSQNSGPRVLVLTPTRELAMQVNENIEQFSRYCHFTNGTVLGGTPYPPQNRLLKKPLDILVATPGRLMDHMAQGRVNFSRLEVLVLDEADRMLDMGFIGAVRKISAAIPKNRQTLLFSATLEGKVLSIAKELLQNPARVQLAANNVQHASIQQHVLQADNVRHKSRLLTHFLMQDEMTQAVVFAATKRGADRMARSLGEQGHKTAALHGDMNQSKRKRTMERMRTGKVRVLVATDVAARGLDIKGISHVINFDLPMVAEDYIHRIGRTGRGGATGTAVSLVGPEDWSKLADIERLTGRKLKRSVIAGLEPVQPEPLKKPGGGKKSFSKPRRSTGNKPRIKYKAGKNRNRSMPASF
jgi:superfamily II DNA/RNA helicase